MASAPSRARLLRRASTDSRWELALRDPAPELRRYVRGSYCGYVETAPSPVRRRELPGFQSVLIFDFGPPLRILDNADTSRSARHASGFVAGPCDTFSLTEHDGFSHGLQVNLTPLGARLFFAVPMVEIANRVVGVGDLLGAEGRRVAHELGELADWDARFDRVDRFVGARIARARAETRLTTWALDRIEASGGVVDIGALARATGYSQKHVIHQFRDHVGLPPKLTARLVRFDRVVQHLKAGGGGSWAAIAAAFGYYDQAHLVRDFRQFAGGTPTEVRKTLFDPAGA